MSSPFPVSVESMHALPPDTQRLIAFLRTIPATGDIPRWTTGFLEALKKLLPDVDLLVARVVYTWPEIAGVGLTEEHAKKKGEVKIGKFPMLANSRAKTNHEPDGFVKVIADADSDRVLGVWCIASVAGTMIAQAAQAMEFGATSEDIAYTCHAHTTHSEAIKEAAMAVTGKPIHI